MRAADPAAAAARFAAAGRLPDDLAAEDRVPLVKICGITDAPGILAALHAGADAIGLNLVPGTPRALDLSTAVELAGSPGPALRRPAGPGSWPSRPMPASSGSGRSWRRSIPTSSSWPARRASTSSDGSIARPGRPSGCPGRSPPSDVELEATSAVARGPGLSRRRGRADPARHRRWAPSGRHGDALGDEPRCRGRPSPAGRPGRRPGSGQRRRGGSRDPGDRRRRRLRRRGARASPESRRARIRSGLPSSRSVPGPPAGTDPTCPPGRPRSSPGCSRPTPTAAGAATANTAAGTSPRR